MTKPNAEKQKDYRERKKLVSDEFLGKDRTKTKKSITSKLPNLKRKRVEKA